MSGDISRHFAPINAHGLYEANASITKLFAMRPTVVAETEQQRVMNAPVRTSVMVILGLIFLSRPLMAQKTSPPPPPYDPYPPGILPADLQSEIDRVRGE